MDPRAVPGPEQSRRRHDQVAPPRFEVAPGEDTPNVGDIVTEQWKRLAAERRRLPQPDTGKTDTRLRLRLGRLPVIEQAAFPYR